MASDLLTQLQAWYADQCDGDWEHTYGITIESLDNPGWRVQVDLVGTRLARLIDEGVQVEHSATDWLHWSVSDGRFVAACGPSGLGGAISAFLALTR